MSSRLTQGISEWNSDERANRCAYVSTNLPVAIFGSGIISLQCIHECIFAIATGLFRLFKMSCIFIGQFENGMGCFTLKIQIRFPPSLQNINYININVFTEGGCKVISVSFKLSWKI